MIDSYYDILTKIENFVDGLVIVNENGIIRYNKNFERGVFSWKEKDHVGKSILEVYPNLTEDTSTLLRALKYGETTINQPQKLVHSSGEEAYVIDNTFPVIENGKIVGAVSTSKFVEGPASSNFIDITNMTSTYLSDIFTVKDIIGKSRVIEELRYKIHRVSQTSSSILIYGETGVGKELVAQSIHSSGVRKGKTFISQNCAAIPYTLLESIFFGTVKGSYTGAENRPGIFEIADGGTIFLDELNSMDLNMQAKLLRVIEEKKVMRLGGNESKRFDVRIIAALNESPEVCIKEGRIRKDLYYRLAGIELKVPALRERLEDIPELASSFISSYNKSMNRSIKGLSAEVLSVFNSYKWPGNIREFKNVIEAAFNFADSEILTLESLPEFLLHEKIATDSGELISLPDAVDSFEKNLILNYSSTAKGAAELADMLGISRQTLNYKLRKYSIELS